MPFRTYSFENLEVYQLARKLRIAAFQLTRSFPRDEIYGLTSQLRRSISSIADNLAEGSGKSTPDEKARFTNMAFCSGLESINHLLTAFDLKYITEEIYSKFREDMDKVLFMANRLYVSQVNQPFTLKSKIRSKNIDDNSETN